MPTTPRTTPVSTFAQRLRVSASSDAGQALTEYALILFLVTIVSVGVLWALGIDVATMLDVVESQFDGESGEAPTPAPDPTP